MSHRFVLIQWILQKVYRGHWISHFGGIKPYNFMVILRGFPITMHCLGWQYDLPCFTISRYLLAGTNPLFAPERGWPSKRQFPRPSYQNEWANPWRQPKNLYLLVVLNLKILPPKNLPDILFGDQKHDETHFQSLSRPSRPQKRCPSKCHDFGSGGTDLGVGKLRFSSNLRTGGVFPARNIHTGFGQEKSQFL